MGTAELNREDRRCVRTRRAIKQILRKLLVEKRADCITIKEIAERADINRKTFYSHYRDINAVLEDLQNDLAEKLCGVLKGCETGGILRDPYPFFQKLTEVLGEDLDLYQYLAQSKSAGSFWGKIKETLKRGIMDTLCEEGKAGKETLSLAAEFIVSGILSIYREWIGSERKASLSQISNLAGSLARSSLNLLSGGGEWSKC